MCLNLVCWNMETNALNLHPAPVYGKERNITPATESPPPAISGKFMPSWRLSHISIKLCLLEYNFWCSHMILCFSFPSLLQWVFIHFVMTYKFVLPSPIIHQQYLSDFRQISNNVTNFSKSDLPWKHRVLRLSEQRKWPPDIHNSLLSWDRKSPGQQSGPLYDSLIPSASDCS